jgi:cysteine desulfurase / selenocysteine lyase
MSELKVKEYDVELVRARFPILEQEVNGCPMVYLDSAATTQKPLSVIDSMSDYYLKNNANVHRGIYTLSARATNQYEAARQTIRDFVGAKHNHEIIFTRSATEALNLVASSYSKLSLQAGDEVLVSVMEHHSSMVPWQEVCKQHGATLNIIDMSDDGLLDISMLEKKLTDKVKMVVVMHVSNVTGVINPIKKIVAMAHAKNIPVTVDGTQAVPHMNVDVVDMDCDFYVFSGHKMYGPTGIGVLYGKETWLRKMPPYQFGGDMIRSVSLEQTEYNDLPHKFEAGTTNISGVIGLAESINFLTGLGFSQLQQHEAAVMRYARLQLAQIDGLRLLCSSDDRIGVISFVLEYAHPHDIATILDQFGVAIRAGHHCAMPLMNRLGVAATARISFAAYTSFADIDRCVEGLQRVTTMFK